MDIVQLKADSEKTERKDPTSFLPEEAMSYEIKKKKKKKKKRQEDDPFKDIHEKSLVTERIVIPEFEMESILDPEVQIKVEDIDCDLNLDDFTNNEDDFMKSDYNNIYEPEVKIEQQSHEAAILTFQNIVNNRTTHIKSEVDENGKKFSTENHMCKLCHLVFKNQRSLQMHQKRKHKIFRRTFTHVCDYCDMSYEFKTSLKTHIKRRHGPGSAAENEEKACDICSLVFKGISRLRMHMRRKHGAFEESFTHVCEDCGLTYEKYSSLFVHRRRKHSKTKKVEEVWLSCPFCPKIYNHRETYARHLQRNHHTSDDGVPKTEVEFFESYKNEAGEFMCKQCPLVFSSVHYLKLHMRRKHNALKDCYRLKCKVCNLSYDNRESLKRHIKRKHDQGSFCNQCNKQFGDREKYLNHTHARLVRECNICGQIFSSQGALAKHLRCKHKKDSPLVVFCHICAKGFHDKRQLRPHMSRVHFNVTYTCSHCQKKFKSRDTYQRHITFKHQDICQSNSELQKCEQCSELFEDEFELCKHVNMAHRDPNVMTDVKVKIEAEDQKFQCIKCPEQYPTWDELRNHFELVHYKVNSCQCQICGDIVVEKDLQKHIKQSHTEAEELKCRFCDYKTDIKVTLTQHMLRHKNASTLDCDFPNCRYKTFYKAAMEKHKQKHESQGVKLQCSKCAFQTMNKYILKYHEEAHLTGKKRYQCDQCDYATILPANLVQHKYKHSAEKRFKCDVCPFATKYNTSLRFHVKKKHCDLPSLVLK